LPEITDEEFKLFERLKTILKHDRATELPGVYFICGEMGDKDQMGLPEMIMVCPAYGVDGFALYKKATDYTAPSW
jgi:hypothetical protein